MARHWRDFKYEQWQKENAEFDHEKWKRESQAYMDEVFSQDSEGPTLATPIKANPPERYPWKPTPYYNVDGDEIEIHLSDEMYKGKWLCPGVDLLISDKTGEVVGIVLSDIKYMVAKAIAERDADDADAVEAIMLEKITEREADDPIKNS